MKQAVILIGVASAIWAPLAVAQTFGPPSARKNGPPPVSQPAPPLVPPPSAPAINACSSAYYTALEPLRTGRGAALAGLHRALRTPDPELPGKWQVTALTGKPKLPPKPERVCAETKEIPGRAPRCVRFEMKQPVVPPEVVSKLPPTADEARILKTFGDFIEAKGALPDVGNNGRHNFLVQRVAQDLRLYANQPQHPNLCAGSAEILEFYSGQIAPLKKRLDEVQASARQVNELAATRVRGVAVAEMKAYDKAVTDAAKVEETRTKLIETYKAAVMKVTELAATRPPEAPPLPQPPQPVLPQVPALPTKPSEPAQLADYAAISFSSLLAETLRPLLPAAKVTEVTSETQPVKAIVKARAALLDTETPASTAAPDVREASLLALRLLEARAYADAYVSRFKELDVALFGALTDLRKAQTTSCTCKD